MPIGRQCSPSARSILPVPITPILILIKQSCQIEEFSCAPLVMAYAAFSLVLGYLAAGSSPDEIVAEFPDLTRDQIAACLDYARDLAEFAVEA